MELLAFLWPSSHYHCSPVFPTSVNDITVPSLNMGRSHPCCFSSLSVAELHGSPAGGSLAFCTCHHSAGSCHPFPFHGLPASASISLFLPSFARIILRLHPVMSPLAWPLHWVLTVLRVEIWAPSVVDKVLTTLSCLQPLRPQAIHLTLFNMLKLVSYSSVPRASEFSL